MKALVLPLFALLVFTTPSLASRKPSDAVLLSKVKSLTLKRGAETAHRRAAAVPELKCVGGSARGLFEPDEMRCMNEGPGYEEGDIQWTCSATLPPEFKLGSTEVVCEGYGGPKDPYVLKGSCGVEYRLMLTEEGERKYGGSMNAKEEWHRYRQRENEGGLPALLFWMVFIAVGGFMLYKLIENFLPGVRRRPRGTSGGGGGGPRPPPPPPPHDDPPPPYEDYSNKRGSYASFRSAPGPQCGGGAAAAAAGGQGWRPGFWTGLAGGAAAAYAAAGGRRQRQAPPPPAQMPRWQFPFGGGGRMEPETREWRAAAAAPPRMPRSDSSSSASYSTTRYESTGFGGTSRR